MIQVESESNNVLKPKGLRAVYLAKVTETIELM